MADVRRANGDSPSGEPGRSARALRSRLSLMLAGMFGLTFVVLAVMVETPPALSIDRTTRALVQWERSPALEFPMRTLSGIGSGFVLVPLAMISGLVLWRRRRALGVFMLALTGGAILADWLAKWVVARPRPRLGPHAFPSGHVLTSVVVFGALIYVLWRLVDRPLWRWGGTTGCVLLVLGIAYSRLYLDAHWATDVFGSLAGGIACLLVAVYCVERDLRWFSSSR